MRKVDLAAALATFDEPWSPRIVACYKGNKVSPGRLTPKSGGPATAAPEAEV